MSYCSIHQFSSGIRDPKQLRSGKWVTQGFGKEIENESHNIPQEIKDAVNTQTQGGYRLFGILNGYPPKENEYALIAWELGRYCVLAVANSQADETGRGRFTTYRYFWLDKETSSSPRDTDGIATLLYHWDDQGKPDFNIEQLDNDPDSYKRSWTNLSGWRLYDHSKEWKGNVNELLKNISRQSKPMLYESSQANKELTPKEVHWLSIQYSNVNDRKYISWAWNVRRLDNYLNLGIIYCADPEAYNWFSSHLSRLSSPSNTTLTAGGNVSKHTQIMGLGDITRTLLAFRGTFTSQHVLELINYYQQYLDDIVQFKDENFLVRFKRSMPSLDDPPLIKYATLITALSPSKGQDILTQLMNLTDDNKMVAICFLNDVNEMALEVLPSSQFRDNNNEFFLTFWKNFSYIQHSLFNPLRVKSYRFRTNFFYSLLRPFPRQLQLAVFVFLGIGLLGGLLCWQWTNISTNITSRIRLPFNISVKLPKQDTDPTSSSPSNPSQGQLGNLINKYDKSYRSSLPFLEQNNSEDETKILTDINNRLDKYRKEIVKLLEEKRSLFITKLKSDDSSEIQDARKETTYTDLKDIIPKLESSKLPTLKVGERDLTENNNNMPRKWNITMLQIALQNGKYNVNGNSQDIVATGTFDEQTKAAVTNAQSRAKSNNGSDVGVNGIVGKETWEILIKRLEDIQVIEVYEVLLKHLKESNPPNHKIIDEIKKCRDRSSGTDALNFTGCLKNIPDPQQSSKENN